MVQYNQLKNESGVYCFKNLVNGKCYIGYADNLKRKLRAHYTNIKAKSNLRLLFYKDVFEHGIENFDLDILEFTDNSNRSNYYINVLQGIDISSIDNGYVKEDTIIEAKLPIWVREINKSEYSYGLNIKEASEKTNVSEDIIVTIINNAKTLEKPYVNGWTFAIDEITLFNNCAKAFRDIAKGNYKLKAFKKGQRTSNKL